MFYDAHQKFALCALFNAPRRLLLVPFLLAASIFTNLLNLCILYRFSNCESQSWQPCWSGQPSLTCLVLKGEATGWLRQYIMYKILLSKVSLSLMTHASTETFISPPAMVTSCQPTLSTLSVTAVKFASGSKARVLSSNYHTPDKCKLSHFHNSYRYEINEKIIACIIASNNPY